MITKIDKISLINIVLSILVLLQCYIILFQLFTDTIRFLSLAGIWAIFFILSLRRFSFKVTLIRAIIYSIPISFFSVMGTNYRTLPISFFSLFSLLLLIFILAEWTIVKRIRVKEPKLIFLLILLILCSIIPTAYSLDVFNATKQLLNVILFCMLVTLTLVITVPSRIVKILAGDYLRVAIITTIGLLSQIIVYKYFGIVCGKIDVMGGMRTAYGFLFSDYSFLSLYLSSAALITITLMLYNHKVNLTLIFCSLVLLYGSILTTARTGIVALLCALVFYGIIIFIKRPLITVSVIIIMVVITGFYIGYSVNQRADMINSSDRIEGYSIGLQQLEDNLVFGTGFGVKSYAEHYGIAIPHNIVIQYFVQGGVLVGLLVTFILISLLLIVFKYAYAFFLPISTIIIGSQFIPDIFNSRFFSVIIMIALLSVGYSMRQEVNVIENSPALIIE